MHFFHSAILAFGHMEEELSTACRAAADALEILSHLRPGFTRNVTPRMNSTAVPDGQPNNGDRQVNNEELQSNERAIQSSTSPASSSSFQARLATLFPTVGSNRGSRSCWVIQTCSGTAPLPPAHLFYNFSLLVT